VIGDEDVGEDEEGIGEVEPGDEFEGLVGGPGAADFGGDSCEVTEADEDHENKTFSGGLAEPEGIDDIDGPGEPETEEHEGFTTLDGERCHLYKSFNLLTTQRNTVSKA
jgi:hypothetical protein